MKQLRVMWRISFLLIWMFFGTAAQAREVIKNPEDLLAHIENNFDLNLAKENTRKAQASLNKLLGTLYYPEIAAKASYTDDQREPFSPFQSSRRQDVFWETYLESKTPAGVTMTVGKNFVRSRLGQSDPPSALLPYPATFYQPEAFVRLSIDLTRNFLGYTTRKQLAISKTDVEAALLQEKLLKHKFGVTALGVYYQLSLLNTIHSMNRSVIAEFRELQSSIASKVDRSLAEKSDLYSIKAAIARQEGVMKDTDRAMLEIKEALVVLLGDSTLVIASSGLPPSAVGQGIGSCETKLLATSFDPALSDEFSLLSKMGKNADLKAKLIKSQLLPEVKLSGTAATSGTASTYGSSLEELGNFNRPYYDIGLNFTWQPSFHGKKAAKQASLAERNVARLQSDKRFHELQALWDKTRQKIRNLVAKQKDLSQAISASQEEMAELRKQYFKGRLSLFELIQKRVELLRSSIESEAVRQERLTNLTESLQYFDGFQCDFLGSL